MGSACCREAAELRHVVSPYQHWMWESASSSSYGCPCSEKASEDDACQDSDVEYENVAVDEIDHLLRELFRLHDLNGNGYLEVEELVQLNSKVAMLHHGKDVDLLAVKDRYRSLFRERLDPDGRPVPYSVFRGYVLQVLDSMDPDPLAQEMILEQFAAEARSARAVFHCPSFSSHADKAFLPSLSFHASFEVEGEEMDSFVIKASHGPLRGGASRPAGLPQVSLGGA
eukprot:TRINITY_DN61598_c0_g1_i1.p1 TRINITY_DN61598_c0_g1~~TRINITY_DN61598_c0_g1_i1.p1  ORF type:complete len:227 (-),score=46.65 TRINITY_DN61598_c0_g1_i1:86-766(-)